MIYCLLNILLCCCKILSCFKLNAFEYLNLPFDSSVDEVKRQYRKLSLLVHPDKCKHPQSKEAFGACNQNWFFPTHKFHFDRTSPARFAVSSPLRFAVSSPPRSAATICRLFTSIIRLCCRLVRLLPVHSHRPFVLLPAELSLREFSFPPDSLYKARMERVYNDQVYNFSKAFNSLNEHLRRQSRVFLHSKLLLMNNEEMLNFRRQYPFFVANFRRQCCVLA
ncbi:hypothetical protein MIMGU_mgv11b014837mg [Erythranthe guttata]|uniref:J domain-containing protein n=1 Tax=Erythranthe guttata TaxID=4155 RepID=A0A022PU14_ERYGU|nr:hypothetical protein MIMGU_mgv11b014837mg [Erythranthe guttata]